jgi:hypothetical protein
MDHLVELILSISSSLFSLEEVSVGNYWLS